jgi:NADH-ubiquinone oxidoreductase chain 6
MITLFGSIAQDIFAFAAVISSLLVITSKNPVISVLFLISVFVNSAIYLMFTGINFIGISYIIVYVGAIAILFLFILMMINIKLTDILEVGKDYTKNLPLALIIGALFIFAIFGSVTNLNIFRTSLVTSIIHLLNSFFSVSTSLPAGIPLVRVTDLMGLTEGDLTSVASLNNFISLHTTVYPYSVDTHLMDYTQIEALGHNLYTNSAILLILTSFILLLSMLAPIMLSNFYKKVA